LLALENLINTIPILSPHSKNSTSNSNKINEVTKSPAKTPEEVRQPIKRYEYTFKINIPNKVPINLEYDLAKEQEIIVENYEEENKMTNKNSYNNLNMFNSYKHLQSNEQTPTEKIISMKQFDYNQEEDLNEYIPELNSSSNKDSAKNRKKSPNVELEVINKH